MPEMPPHLTKELQPEVLDVSPYVATTRFTGTGGVFLARAVLRAAPPVRSRRLEARLETIRAAAEALRAVVRARMRDKTRGETRALATRLGAGWVGLREALEARARLVGDPLGDRARELAASLFPDGTAFVRARFDPQWVGSQLHLERIDEEGLAPELDALGVGGFLPYIRAAHAAFGEALGVGAAPVPTPDPTAVHRASAALARALADYGRVLAGELEPDDPESVRAFRAAVHPLDAHRRRRRAAARPTTPETLGPTAAGPIAAGPTAARPTAAEPTAAGPTAAGPTAAEPTAAEPIPAEPTAAGPTAAEPTTAGPTTAQPTAVGPTAAEPTAYEPTIAGPTTAGRSTAEPTAYEPTIAEPTAYEPTSSEPTSYQPTPPEPTAYRPTPTKPTSYQPTPTAPALREREARESDLDEPLPRLRRDPP